MTHVASFARVAFATTVCLALASACGGQSFTNGNNSDGGDAGTTSQGGSSNHAGTTSTGGKGHAGTSSQGGTAVGGTGNVGGTVNVGGSSPYNEACDAPPESGNCDAYVPSWYNDPSTGVCRPFVYGGCGGNLNRYASLEACQRVCPGGTPNYDQCKLASDCVVDGTGCCGVCDSPGITEHDLIAYNRAYAGAFQCFGGPLPMQPAGGSGAGAPAPVACAPCQQPAEGTGTLAYFVPNCVAGQCVVEDLRKTPITACKTSNECRLRHGSGCCEGCSSGDLISVRNDGSLEKLVCGEGPVGCPACAPPPTNAQANCGPEGRCEIVLPL